MADSDNDNDSDVQTTSTGETEYSAPRDKGGKKECSRIEAEKGANGGYIATCYYKQKDDGKGRGLSYIEPSKSAFSTFSDLVAYMADEFGESTPASSDGGGAAPPAPPASGSGY